MKRNDVLKFIIDHERLDNFFDHFRWYRNLCRKRGEEVISGRKRGKK